jgi:DNA-binding MarR family transcriptional regulator
MAAGNDNNTTDLDWISRDILISLHQQDGVANVTEIKESSGVESNQKIAYRFFEKLEPRNLIQVNSPEPVNNQPQPKVASLTSRGEGLAHQLINESESEEVTTSEEVEQLRAEVNKLSSKLDGQGGQAGGTDSDELAEVFDRLDSLGREGDGSWDAQSLAEEIHALRQGMYGMRDYLLENTEMTGDELEDHIQQWMNQK